MSRRMTAPGVWVQEEGESVHVRARSPYANVPAATIPDMTPLLRHGGNTLEAHTGYRQKALRVKP